jgi:hypothetical protein
MPLLFITSVALGFCIERYSMAFPIDSEASFVRAAIASLIWGIILYAILYYPTRGIMKRLAKKKFSEKESS